MIRSGSTSDAAATFSRRCSVDDVPGISRILDARCSSHAKATAKGVRLSEVAELLNTDDCRREKPPSGKMEHRPHRRFQVGR